MADLQPEDGNFWRSLQVEEPRGQGCETREKAKQSVFVYIEDLYNPTRLHSSLGYKSGSSGNNSVRLG